MAPTRISSDEPIELSGAEGVGIQEDLDRHLPAEVGIGRRHHATHPAAPELELHLEAAERQQRVGALRRGVEGTDCDGSSLLGDG